MGDVELSQLHVIMVRLAATNPAIAQKKKIGEFVIVAVLEMRFFSWS